MDEQVQWSEYGLLVEVLMQARGMCGGDLLVEELQSLLEDEAGFSVTRKVLREHLSGSEKEHNYDLGLAILGVLDLDEGETEEFAVWFCFKNFAPAV